MDSFAPPEKLVVLPPSYNVFGKFLLMALDKADRWTLSHSLIVAEICEVLARQSRGAHGEPETMWLAGLMHDIGKLGIEMAILEKPGPLDDVEDATMKEHSFMGYRTLHRMFDHWTLSATALHHHERYDGSGYPAKMIATDIPIPARIAALSDAYDTIRGERPYKRAQTHQWAIIEIINCSGSQFDPDVVRVFSQTNQEIEKLYDDIAGKTNAELHDSVWEKLSKTRWSNY